MRAAVVFALREEADPFVDALSEVQHRTRSGVSLFQGSLRDGSRGTQHEVHVAVGGMGKVAAAGATSLLLALYNPDLVLSVGIAGGLDPDLRVGTAVTIERTAQYDFDARPFVGTLGHIPHLGTAEFLADTGVESVARDVCCSLVPTKPGMVVSGDRIVSEPSARKAIRDSFPAAACVDMETAAVAQTAWAAGVPWGGFRVVSDGAAEEFETPDVLAFLGERAAPLIADVIPAVLSTWALRVGCDGESGER